MTGSGKTTFISKVTGRTDLQIGHDLTSCTLSTSRLWEYTPIPSHSTDILA